MAVLLCIRDPDEENEYVGDDDIEIITVDIGSEWRSFKELVSALEDKRPEAEEWVAGVRERVAHLDPDHPARKRVDELIDTARSWYA